MNNKVIALAVVGVLGVAAIAGVLLLTMGNTTGNGERTGNTDDAKDDGNAPVDEGKANFIITSLDVSEHNVLTDQTAIVTIGLMNNGTADGTYELNITLDGNVVKTRNVFIGMGNSTTVTHPISSSVVGNHTVAAGGSSTYLHCYDFYAVGAFMTYRSVEADAALGTREYNYTFTYVAQTSSTYTVSMVYENDVYPSSTNTYSKSGPDQSNRENVTFVGMENVTTLYGEKRLAHYTYTFESSGFHFEVDSYKDDWTGVVFKAVTRADGYSVTEELIDTNREWIKDI